VTAYGEQELRVTPLTVTVEQVDPPPGTLLETPPEAEAEPLPVPPVAGTVSLTLLVWVVCGWLSVMVAGDVVCGALTCGEPLEGPPLLAD
jgi:hypothetical protein